jgi:type I restriction enzyme S subunit
LTGHQSFLYHQLLRHFIKEDIIGAGAIFASVTRKEFEEQRLLTPSAGLVDNFERVSIPVDDQITKLFLQNKLLSEARDILLPKLINGEIEI